MTVLQLEIIYSVIDTAFELSTIFGSLKLEKIDVL